jgi:hypothetical protein
MPTNNTIVLGTVGTFTSSLFPAGSVLATPTTVPVWTCNDPLATLTPDVTGFNVAVATSASDTATILVLTETAPTLGGAIISTPLTVTLLPATGGGGVPATGFTQSQVS